MLTVDYDRLRVGHGTRFADVGAGAGRHSYEALRRGAHVTAYDLDEGELDGVKGMFAAMELEGQVPPGGTGEVVVGDVLAMPFDDASYDVVLASEILEHVPQDAAAVAELVRILAPGGMLAVTVPRWWPERVCWALSDEYHANEGGHVRVYRASDLVRTIEATGLLLVHRHHAHALHAPYWWLKCAVGVHDDEHPAVRAYHRMLVWDLMSGPAVTRVTERALNPVLGKSVALYFEKPA
ncbi:class I SAM-dependent methyltransferase [Lapillicoccus jejuensis]|uniref:Methyltransferase family protein n=1 Tax=Lapillicoccus jejuensis TaxID=402171 RepID=A0A542DVG6_9MICO|nr:class I SAM-dependent methyltransferase [Lapillicoccus jejuensis]TQJ07068.1 methyltransferase family protein [Lapillicoccus jejuensis]